MSNERTPFSKRADPQRQVLDKMVSGEIVTGCEAYENLRFFCDEGGGRFGGSAGEVVRVRDFLLKKLKEYGLENVHTEEYFYTGWERGPATLKVTKATGSPDAEMREFPCFSLPHSPSGAVRAHKSPEEVAALIAHLKEVFEMEGRSPNGASRGM